MKKVVIWNCSLISETGSPNSSLWIFFYHCTMITNIDSLKAQLVSESNLFLLVSLKHLRSLHTTTENAENAVVVHTLSIFFSQLEPVVNSFIYRQRCSQQFSQKPFVRLQSYHVRAFILAMITRCRTGEIMTTAECRELGSCPSWTRGR